MPQSRGNIIITDGSGGVSFIPIGNNGESIMCNSAAQDKWGYYQPTSKYFAAYNSTGGTNINLQIYGDNMDK